MAEPCGEAVLGRQAPAGFIHRYIFSTDHKVIGRQYFFLALLSVIGGMVLSWLMRVYLAWPKAHLPGLGSLSPAGAPGGVVKPEYYLSLLTLHGTLMIFFVLTTVPQNGFGNFFLPLQIGARRMAFPRLNMLSFWLTFISLAVLLSTLLVSDGPPISGWTAYPPLSAVGGPAGPGEGLGQALWVVSIGIFCLGSLLGSINFIATTLDLRAPGMALMRLPLTCWAWFITAVISLPSFAVLLGACVMLLLDRFGLSSFFVPAGLVVSDQFVHHAGGSPLLWQHLFWFFGHPEVYIAILPGMGIISHVLACFSRRPVFGYPSMVLALGAIGFLSFTVWGHHMFVSGMSPYSGLAFSVFTLIIAVPSTLETFNWLGTMWGGRLRFTASMLFAIGFVSVFVTGGLSGLFLAQPAEDAYLHATYFVVGHFHLVMGVAAVFAIFAGTYFWAPKLFGRMLSERLGKIHFWLTFVGAYCIFMPMHFMGLEGAPRRYAIFTDRFLLPLGPLNRFMTVATLATGAAQLIFLFNLFWSLFKGRAAARNPWEATSLEWTVASPPPVDSFGGRQPVVFRGPYEYSVPGRRHDYLMQDAPDSALEPS
ncbi:MAG TPA: cbb3-type cytochrome c oxidase subunit I [Terriglobia bacterium]|nr:cbb3-type cytochrome c oxidase subunit I [Terriglobia bacterium]